MSAMINTPRDAAKALLRPYVLRGDSVKDIIKARPMQTRGDYWAVVGCFPTLGSYSWLINVRRVGDENCYVCFDIADIRKELVTELGVTITPRDSGSLQLALPL